MEPLEDFSELIPTGGGVEIRDCAERGITLKQLSNVLLFLWCRTGPGGIMRHWLDQRSGLPLIFDCLNLYHLNHWLIKRATQPRQCSYVEFVSEYPEQQLPEWFVSHWWGEPVIRFVFCLQEVAWQRALKHPAYWICAYSNNQHALDSDVTRDPADSSFYRAMQNTRGVVMVLDSDATCFKRIWCAYEMSIVISSDREPKHLFDLATFVTDSAHTLELAAHEAVSTTEPCVKLQALGSVSVISDGLLPEDESLDQIDRLFGRTPAKKKSLREKTFPMSAAAAGLNISISQAEASVEADKRHILNSIMGSLDLQADCPSSHPAFDAVDSVLRARFAKAILRKTVEEGHAELWTQSLSAILGDDRSCHMVFSFEGCDLLTDRLLSELAASLPPQLESLFIDCDRCTALGDDGLEGLSSGFSRLSGMGKLKFLKLDFRGCHLIGSQGLRYLGRGLVLLSSLTELQLIFEDSPIGKAGLQALGAAFRGLTNLTDLVLTIEDCDSRDDHIGEDTDCLMGLAEGIGKLVELKSLDLDMSECKSMQLRGLGEGIGQISGLEQMRLDFNECTSLRDNVLQGLGAGLGKLLHLGILKLSLQDCKSIGGDGGMGALGQGLGQIACLVDLELDVSGCGNIVDRDVQNFGDGLGKGTNLLVLRMNMRSTGLSDDALCGLGAGLSKLTSLETLWLDISHCKGVGDDGLRGFAAGLGELENLLLLELYFVGCSFGDVGMTMLGDGIGRLDGLRELRIQLFGLVRIGDRGLASFGNRLSKLSNLIAAELSLYRCSVGDVGLQHLGRGLASMASLRKLHLDVRYCSLIGSTASLWDFGQLLGQHSRLTTLELNFGGCGAITDDALHGFGYGLRQLANLAKVRLDFGDCPHVSDTGLRWVGGGLGRSLPLRELRLCFLFTAVSPAQQWIETSQQLTTFLQQHLQEESLDSYTPAIACATGIPIDPTALASTLAMDELVTRRALVPDPYAAESLVLRGIFTCVDDGWLPSSVPNLYTFAHGRFRFAYTERNKSYTVRPDDTCVRQPQQEDHMSTLTAEVTLSLSPHCRFKCRFVLRVTERWGIKFVGMALVTHPDGTRCTVYLPGVLSFDPAGITGDPHASERVGPACDRLQVALTLAQLFVLQREGTKEDLESLQSASSELIHWFSGRLSLWAWMHHQVEAACFDLVEPTPYPLFLQGLIERGVLNLEPDNRLHTREYLTSFQAGQTMVPEAYLKKVGTKDRGCFGRGAFGGLAPRIIRSKTLGSTAAMEGEADRAESPVMHDRSINAAAESASQQEMIRGRLASWKHSLNCQEVQALLRSIGCCLDDEELRLMSNSLGIHEDGNERVTVDRLIDWIYDRA